MSTVNDDVNTTTTPFLPAERPLQGVNWSRYKMPIKGELCWYTIIILVTIVVMILSKDEITKVPLRVWLVGYVIHCAVHMVCAYIGHRSLRVETPWGLVAESNNTCNNIATFVELANKIFFSVWWIIGLYWVISGRHKSANDAPKLFWLTTIYLAFITLPLVITMIMACMVCVCGGLAVFYFASQAAESTVPQEQQRVANLA